MARRKTDIWLWHMGGGLSRLSEEMGSYRTAVASGRHWEPRVDVLEADDRVLVRADLAGVSGEEVSLMYNLERHTLFIRGVRTDDVGPEFGAGIHQLEVPFGEFRREISLPAVAIDPEGIRAEYRNGFLYVILPKRERLLVHSITTIEI